MTQILETSDRGFKITLVSILEELVETIDNMHALIGSFSKEMETIRRLK